MGGVEVGLGLGPRLVVPQARNAGGGVIDNQRNPAELGGVECGGAHAPSKGSEVVEGVLLRKVVEDQVGTREKSKSCVFGRGCDSSEDLKSGEERLVSVYGLYEKHVGCLT